MVTQPLVPRETCDLLSVIPHQLGFTPRSSLVAVSLRGEQRQAGLMMRLDLAALAVAHLRALAESVVSTLRGDGASAVVFALYLEAECDALLVPQDLSGPLGHLERAALANGITPTAYLLTPAAYWRIEDGLAGGVLHWLGPRREIDDRGVYRGRLREAPAPGRSEPLTLAGAEPSARRQAMRVAAGSWRHREAALATWRVDSLAAWRAAIGTSLRPSPTQLGRIEAGLRDVPVRDATMLTLIGGTGDLAERSVLTDCDVETDHAFASVVRGDRGPDDDVAGRARELLDLLAAHAARGRRAAPLSVWAWLEWWCGAGVRASLLVERAVADNPSYSLAGLLGRVLAAGIGPGWLGSRWR